MCDVELQFEKAMMNEVKNVKKRERECEKKKMKTNHPEIIHDFTFYWMMRWYISKSNAFFRAKKLKKE